MTGSQPWRVLVVHNSYQYSGGEDSVVASETDLLRAHGHEVRLYKRHNSEVESLGKASLLVQTIWSRQTAYEIKCEVDKFRPDIVHVHNTFPLISPSVYWAVSSKNVPIIQTIHNFRLICIQAMFLREGRVCEDCLGRTPWLGILRGCYRGSRAASAAAALALQAHRTMSTFQKIDAFIALNQFCRNKLIAGGLPSERIHVKPNFVDPLPVGELHRSGNPLFVGRLSDEKGVQLLAAAASKLRNVEFDIVGSGPLEGGLKGNPQLRMLGSQPSASVYELMRKAPFIVMPSVWYENMPRTLVEAYASGTPVIASHIGALAELVSDEVTGLLFEPGSENDLATKIRWAVSHQELMEAMGRAARAIYEQRYTPESNYKELMDIYRKTKKL